MRILFLILFLSVTCTYTMFAQRISFPQGVDIRPSEITPIIQNGEVIGYTAYHFLKADRVKWYYKFYLMNTNFEITQEIPFDLKLGRSIDDMFFNGTSFCIISSPGYKTYGQFDFVNLEGKLIYSFISKSYGPGNSYNIPTYFRPVKNKGFLNAGPKESEEDGSIVFLNNEGKKVYDIHAKKIPVRSGRSFDESLDFRLVTDSLLVVEAGSVWIDYRKTDHRSVNDVRIFKLNTGEDLNLISMIHKEGRLVPVSFAPRKDGFSICGKYFEFDDTREGYSDENLKGIYMQRFNNEGQLVKEVFVPTERIASLKDQQGKEIIGKDWGIWIQSIIEMANGKTFLIGESYFEGAKVSEKIAIGDFKVIEFDENFSPIKVHQISKIGSKHPFAILDASSYRIGKLVEKWYDYQYSILNSSRTVFTSIYTSYNHSTRNPEEKYTIGAVVYNLDGEIVNPTITLDNFPKNIAFIPAKIGYAAVFEYDEAGKDLSLTLYKFDF
ncbi:MAG TPA: DUF6770 family protein [Saprospiraceae bacterium]|nr:DUF6770 family protein [Saprospiraceae bacterium]